MSSREERARRLQEPEVGSASGGHLAPGTGPLFEPLNEPLPSEAGRREETGSRDPIAGAAPDRQDRTEAFVRSREAASLQSGPPQGTGARRQQVRKRAGLRRVRRTIRHVDPFSVLKLSAFFYAIFLLVWLAFVAVLYSFVESLGVFEAAEDLGRALVLYEEVNITLGVVEKWALLVGLVFGIFFILLNTLLAFLYNIGSDLLGGIELTFVERDA